MLRPTDPPKSALTSLTVLFGSLFLTGFSPVLRGTAGTLVAAGVAALFFYGGLGVAGWWAGAAIFSLFSFIIGRSALKFANDPDWFVLDEAAGFFVTLALIPASSPLDILAGFLTFRLYDIAKPWPLRSFERLPGSLGILTDDLAAGVLAAWTVWAFDAVV